MSYLFELLSQRKQFSNAFYAFKKNMDDNSSQLLGCARLLQLKKSHFFSQKDSLLALESFKEYEKLSSNEQLVLLQLYAKIHDNFSSLLDNLQQSADPKIRLLSDELILIKGKKGLLQKFSRNTDRLQLQLIYCFYADHYEHVLEFVEGAEWEDTPVNNLYFNLLFSDTPLKSDLLQLFIDLKLLDSHLFELFVVALDEKTLTELVNKLASDDNSIKMVIKVMSLSGYSKFVPFLARYLQDSEYTLDAYIALRILMGNKLDELIPSDIQFDSNEKRKKENLGYYGAKMLHYWDHDFLKSLGPRILSGELLTSTNIKSIFKDASQMHRRFASINQIMLSVDDGIPYYSKPEAFL